MSNTARNLPHAAIALALGLVLAAGTGAARAERADRDQPVNIESERMNADDAQKTAVFEGRVVLTQGTLIIRADRLTVRQDGEGFQYGLALGKPATFRQKRDGADEYVDGEGERIEYDGRADRVQLFNRARLRRSGGDDVCGNYISYDSKTEYFTVRSAKDASAQGCDGRVRAVIMPKKTKQAGAAAAPAPSASKPAPAAPGPRQD